MMEKLNELIKLANLANIAGQGTTQMADFRVVANPDTILAIAEAFRALEQRAEAAEALNCHLDLAVRKAEGVSEALRRRAEDAEDKLLFTRPAPAIKLAELVPGDTKRMDWLVSMCAEVRKPLRYGSEHLFHAVSITDEEDDHHTTALREQIDAILRKIEEANR